MTDRATTSSGFRAREKAALAVAFVALVVIGKTISPAKSSAAVAAGTTSAATQPGASPLGVLKGRDHQVEIKSFGKDILYTVRDSNGRILATDIDAPTLSRLFPTITLDKAQARPALMVVDPDR